MARARLIKQSLYTNEELAELPVLARYVYPGLWLLADREGRLEDRPKKIKVELMPFDNCDMEKVLGQLASAGFIQRYEVEGQRFIAIPKFLSHQNPHPHERASKIPEPPEKLNVITCNAEAVKCTASTIYSYSNRIRSKEIDSPSLPSPLWSDCEYLRMSEEEFGKATAKFEKNKLPLDLMPYCVEALENWLAGSTAQAKAARKDPTHYRRLYTAWTLENAAKLRKAAGTNGTHEADRTAKLIAELKAEEASDESK